MSADKTAHGLFQEAEKIIKEFQTETSWTDIYDGAAIMAANLNGLKMKLLEKYPKVIFTNCRKHILNLVLYQSV